MLENYPVWFAVLIVLFAITIGASMVSAVVFKYFRDNWYHVLGGSVITAGGVVLILRSVHENIKLKVGEFESQIGALALQNRQLLASNELLASTNRELTIKANDLSARFAEINPEIADEVIIPSGDAIQSASLEQSDIYLDYSVWSRLFCRKLESASNISIQYSDCMQVAARELGVILLPEDLDHIVVVQQPPKDG